MWHSNQVKQLSMLSTTSKKQIEFIRMIPTIYWIVGAMFCCASFISMQDMAQRNCIPSDGLKALKGKSPIHATKGTHTRTSPGVLVFILRIEFLSEFWFTSMPLQGMSRVNPVKNTWLVTVQFCQRQEIKEISIISKLNTISIQSHATKSFKNHLRGDPPSFFAHQSKFVLLYGHSSYGSSWKVFHWDWKISIMQAYVI